MPKLHISTFLESLSSDAFVQQSRTASSSSNANISPDSVFQSLSTNATSNPIHRHHHHTFFPAPEVDNSNANPPDGGKQGITCGVSDQGKLSCGVPVARDDFTGAPYIIPLINGGGLGEGSGGGAGSLEQQQMAKSVAAEVTREMRKMQTDNTMVEMFKILMDKFN